MFIELRLFWCTTSLLVLFGVAYIPARLAITRQQNPNPEMILILGGTPDRERLAAKLATTHPTLDIWVSSGSSEAPEILQNAGISNSRLQFDCRATDTVTNFTTVVNDFKQRGIQHVYVVTSDFHSSRAEAIATVVFGSQGIAFTPVPVHNPYYPAESQFRILRDVGRSLFWVVTGRTGAGLKQQSISEKKNCQV